MLEKDNKLNDLQLRHKRKMGQFKPLYRRGFIDEISWKDRLIGIKGARGVGKTTLMLQYIHENYPEDENTLYVSLDDLTFSYASLFEMAEQFWLHGGQRLFLDEVHKYENWSQELKNIYDSMPGLQVVFTGSSVLHILGGKADLSRRAVIYAMRGLSFREFLEMETNLKFPKYDLEDMLENHEQIAPQIIKKIKPLAYFGPYLQYGYYPFYLENKDSYPLKLSSTLSLMMETDLPLVLGMDLRYINKLKRLLYILATQVPFKPNISSLAASLEMARHTVVLYLNHLNEAEIINMLYAEGKGYNSLAKPEKIYLFHPNISFAISPRHTNTGNLRETFFLNQIVAKHKAEATTKGDFKVDERFVFEIGGKNKVKSQIQGIADAYIVTDNTDYGIDNKIPLWLFGFLY